ncbi:MoxR-like ATPase [Arthrobacter silviterrae]|uniref:AAA domain-containing protein n=1 Tax=Arthrobacter silviterrae TaxID=2026658 RepID=A0ABX0DAF5_9MICC|nr:AAA family ATPase [Arthrobacter silviterrae]MDQ0279255.1 MoxR-like ATPase [Arthrobacter silviterrae]NGN83626.1 AAA domain-containing protein [Arthrobacter silviterrae]
MHPRETLTAAGISRPSQLESTASASQNGQKPAPMGSERFAELSRDIMAAMNTVIDGKGEAVELALTVLLARGHLLLEDVPGVGKTLLAKALARTLDCSVSRIQFTPDLLPSDITGVSIYNQSEQSFEFRPGAIFANLVIGDEINRASAKTQSALLESMEEHQVTVDGMSYRLQEPFMVIATQNPIEMEGTYPLPEAQRDRFMARISMGYPDTVAELAMLETHQSVNPLDAVQAAASSAEVAAMLDVVAATHVSAAVKEYTVALGQATRASAQLRLGASPRALLQLLRAAKASAALAGRGFVLPDDIRDLAEPVLAHRLIVERRAAGTGTTAADVIADALARIPVPAQASRSSGSAAQGARPGVAGAWLGRSPESTGTATQGAPVRPAQPPQPARPPVQPGAR